MPPLPPIFFSIIWAKSCNLRTSDPIFREKCCLEKSHFYTEQSLMITFIDLILIIICIPEFYNMMSFWFTLLHASYFSLY